MQPVQATLNQQSGGRRVLGGLQVVNRAKLKELDADKVAEMLRNDELETIYLHLHSLANLRVIGERLPQPSEETAPPQDVAATDDEVPAADHSAEPTKH